jgi:peroxiredoxin
MMSIFTLSRKQTLYIYLLLTGLLLFTLLISCEDEKPTTTYISGKIINPEVDYIVLSDHDVILDTLKLDENGIFMVSYENIDSGLFSISYPGEYQSFFIDRGDSLSMRANTKAFDETLAFTGSHSRENSYLINLFSEIENSNMGLLKFKNKSPQVFYDNVQKIKEERLEELKKANSKYQLDPRFMDFANFIINLNSYYELERYPVVHRSNIYKQQNSRLPKDFFAHRSRVDIDLPKLLNNFAFRPYVNALASNLAYRNISKRNPASDVNLKGYSYNKERLKVIDSIFENEELQNFFAAGEIRNFIRSRKNADEINLLVEDFLDISSDENVNNQIAQMAATYMDLDPGNALPDFELRDANDERSKLSDHVNKLSVLYYWSTQDKDYAMGIHDQVKDLQIKYPEIEFIGINIDNSSFEKWQDAVANSDFRNSKEYQLVDKSAINRQLALRNSDRSMVIDRNLTIIDPNINLFYYKIETTLLGYLNR